MQEKLGFQVDNTLFIDDSPSVLEAARQFGVRHVYAIDKHDSQLPPLPHKHSFAVIKRHIECF